MSPTRTVLPDLARPTAGAPARRPVRIVRTALALVALALALALGLRLALAGEARDLAALLLGASLALSAATWTHAVVALRRDAVARRGERPAAFWPWGFDLLEAGLYFAAYALHLHLGLLAAAFVAGKAVAGRVRARDAAEGARVPAAEPFVGSLVNLAAALVGAGVAVALG